MGGLLIAGLIIPVDGIDIIGAHDAEWAHLSPGDGIPRKNWPQQVILHKTLADDPERILPGRGPAGHAQRTAEFWQQDPKHSGAHLVVADDCVACLADLANFEAWHANQSNYRSVGIEHCEEPGGIVREATLETGVKICLAIAEHMGIQLQVPAPGTYHEGAPMRRFLDGGSTLTGFFGHRNVTSTRGRWDPGERIFGMLIAAGAEAYDFDAGEDLVAWKQRQSDLNARGYRLVVDGIPGLKTTAALVKEGYRGGCWALGKAT